MACNPDDIHVVAVMVGVPGAVIIDYMTADDLADVEATFPFYFDVGKDKFRAADILRVTADDGKAIYKVEGAFTHVSLTRMATVNTFDTLS